MRTQIFTYLLVVVTWQGAFCQTTDTTYINEYSQKIMIGGYVSNNYIQVGQNKVDYKPNNPLTVGVGFGLKRIGLSLSLGYGLVPLRGKEFGRTKITDFQIHQYGRKFIIDAFFQRYRGFFVENKGIQTIETYPDYAVQQIGAEVTYVFNNRKLSTKAAFMLNERQLKSAGSFLVAGGMYFYEINQGENTLAVEPRSIDNLQLGASTGYAYSWIINEHWQLVGLTTVGIHVGNSPDLIKNGRLEIYPTVFARGSVNYQMPNWAVSFGLLLNNKSVYPSPTNTLTVTAVNMQVSYVKRLDRFWFGKKYGYCKLPLLHHRDGVRRYASLI